MAIPKDMMYSPRGSKTIKVRRFNMDDDCDKADFEKLATAHARKEVRFVKEPSEIYSQKEDKLYLFVQWEQEEE